jgi:hypothetical protein
MKVVNQFEPIKYLTCSTSSTKPNPQGLTTFKKAYTKATSGASLELQSLLGVEVSALAVAQHLKERTCT